ncbi:MAG TPA: polyphosphate:AMP phosphotransferase [Burkholderiaceae bacterium]|nr:polyphosphate:AMP phosphotransferase [Burkholderiaceae bacterium]
MFESAEIGHSMGKKAYREAEKVLRQALLEAQFALLEAKHRAVVVLINGVDGAGKGETVNLFNEWMDPRHVRTEAFTALTPAEHEHMGGHPEMWRFWQVLPPKGHIGILFGNWYTDPIVQHALGTDKKSRFKARLEDIRAFERMLTSEGVMLVKLWFHMSKDHVEKRLKELSKSPKTSWRVTDADRNRLANYEVLANTSAAALRMTSTGEAPWLVVDGSDANYRSITAGQYLLSCLQKAAATETPQHTHAAPQPPAPLDGRSLLATQDYARSLERKDYDEKLEDLQGRLNKLLRAPELKKRSLVLVFEGMDAAGKGSTIRRITQAMDARHYRVIPVAAPNEAERAQPYLWRFWRYLPRWQHTAIFDRSWYGRVLVERIEGFCSEAAWTRAYDEINAFEEQQTDAGAIVVKFWLAITPEQQLARFEARQNTPYKAYKITAEDWRNRDKWPQYARAVDDMIDRTSTELAPWHIVASDDKLWSRIEVLRVLCDRLQAVVDGN